MTDELNQRLLEEARARAHGRRVTRILLCILIGAMAAAAGYQTGQVAGYVLSVALFAAAGRDLLFGD